MTHIRKWTEEEEIKLLNFWAEINYERGGSGYAKLSKFLKNRTVNEVTNKIRYWLARYQKEEELAASNGQPSQWKLYRKLSKYFVPKYSDPLPTDDQDETASQDASNSDSNAKQNSRGSKSPNDTEARRSTSPSNSSQSETDRPSTRFRGVSKVSYNYGSEEDDQELPQSKPPFKKWTLEEDLSLLKTWAKYGRNRRHLIDYRKMSNPLKRFTNKAIRCKISSFVTKYNEETKSSTLSGQPSEWCYYRILDKILSNEDYREIEKDLDDAGLSSINDEKEGLSDKSDSDNESTTKKVVYLTRANWPKEDELLLLNLWLKYCHDLKASTGKNRIYAKIAKSFPGYNAQTIQKKILKFGHRFREERDLKQMTGVNSDWEYYNEVEKILKTQMNTNAASTEENEKESSSIVNLDDEGTTRLWMHYMEDESEDEDEGVLVINEEPEVYEKSEAYKKTKKKTQSKAPSKVKSKKDDKNKDDNYNTDDMVLDINEEPEVSKKSKSTKKTKKKTQSKEPLKADAKKDNKNPENNKDSNYDTDDMELVINEEAEVHKKSKSTKKTKKKKSKKPPKVDAKKDDKNAENNKDSNYDTDDIVLNEESEVHKKSKSTSKTKKKTDDDLDDDYVDDDNVSLCSSNHSVSNCPKHSGKAKEKTRNSKEQDAKKWKKGGRYLKNWKDKDLFRLLDIWEERIEEFKDLKNESLFDEIAEEFPECSNGQDIVYKILRIRADYKKERWNMATRKPKQPKLKWRYYDRVHKILKYYKKDKKKRTTGEEDICSMDLEEEDPATSGPPNILDASQEIPSMEENFQNISVEDTTNNTYSREGNDQTNLLYGQNVSVNYPPSIGNTGTETFLPNGFTASEWQKERLITNNITSSAILPMENTSPNIIPSSNNCPMSFISSNNNPSNNIASRIENISSSGEDMMLEEPISTTNFVNFNSTKDTLSKRKAPETSLHSNIVKNNSSKENGSKRKPSSDRSDQQNISLNNTQCKSNAHEPKENLKKASDFLTQHSSSLEDEIISLDDDNDDHRDYHDESSDCEAQSKSNAYEPKENLKETSDIVTQHSSSLQDEIISLDDDDDDDHRDYLDESSSLTPPLRKPKNLIYYQRKMLKKADTQMKMNRKTLNLLNACVKSSEEIASLLFETTKHQMDLDNKILALLLKKRNKKG